MEESQQNSMSIADAIALKHELGKMITYRGLNALEIKELKKISIERWRAISGSYDKWQAAIQPLYKKYSLFFFLASLAFSWFLGKYSWIGLGFAMLFVYFYGFNEGRREGYMEGYESGNEEGINAALGLSDEQSKEISDLAIEMQVDETILNSLAKSDATSPSDGSSSSVPSST